METTDRFAAASMGAHRGFFLGELMRFHRFMAGIGIAAGLLR
jgi:hypothetical protein